ncbi:protein singed wings 2 isoform X2 [Lycorma delicatula]|uniref:protein singed wings 2 isoform X2 n=1 Tax=Lycorma delicatula TaxID=130591 RepID=UPI003F512808
MDFVKLNFLLMFLAFYAAAEVKALDDVLCDYNKPNCSLNASKLICSQGLHLDNYMYSRSDIYDLVLCNWPDDNFNLSVILSIFYNINTITIKKSFISNFYGSNSSQSFNELKKLNISNNNIRNLSFFNLPLLTSLDISNNLINYFSINYLNMIPKLQNLYLAGNPLNCSSDMQWFLNLKNFSSIDFVDEKHTLCNNDMYKGKPILGIMKLFQKMEMDCPIMCICTLDKVVGDLLPIITVNCDNLGLTRFPEKLPINTTILKMKYNKIESVMPLVTDKQYWNVKDVFLDYNLIDTIDILEGSYWLFNFRVLSLQGNFLTQLHTYSLDNAFERNRNLMRIYFGFNPWQCDCVFTPHFRIAELPVKALCADHSLPLHPLDYLSIIFASLTLSILGKLFYDWWNFKRTGNVPWIVTNMP